MQNITVNSTEASQRLDVFTHKIFSELSRSHVQKLILDSTILVNNKKEKTGYKLKINDVVTINISSLQPRELPLTDIPILYEDDDCVVINKPVGVLSHSKGAYNPEATVATFIANKLTNLSGDRAGIVHRLDRATSGVMICAKNPNSMVWLQKQFSQRKTKKTYVAIIKSGLQPSEALIDMPIERNPKIPKQFRVGKEGRAAQTNYKIIKNNSKYALVELKPITGRTHQLRVHLKQLGYPIIGDVLYGGETAERLLLHAKSLEITLPNKLRKVFTARTPQSFTAIMKQ